MCVSCGLPEAEAGESFKQENPVCGDLPDIGYPGRLNRVTQEAEYLGSDGFRVPGKQQEAESGKAAGRKAGLTLQAEDGGKWIYFQTWTIGKLEGMRFATLDYEGLRFDGKECRLELEAGIYRLITTARMPNGNQHASSGFLL